MKRRPFALLCALLALSSAYCHYTVGGTGGGVATPNPDGAACNNDVECASYSCKGGTCVAPADGAVEIDGLCNDGQTCVGDASCQDGICVANGQACAGGCAPCQVDNDCCFGSCQGVCMSYYLETSCSGTGGSGAGGSSGCSVEGASCATDDMCCGVLSCDLNLSVCSSTCATPGLLCTMDDECCSGACDGSECA